MEFSFSSFAVFKSSWAGRRRERPSRFWDWMLVAGVLLFAGIVTFHIYLFQKEHSVAREEFVGEVELRPVTVNRAQLKEAADLLRARVGRLEEKRAAPVPRDPAL